MMICYICKVSVNDLKALVTHYKIIHLLKPNSTFTCCENSCSQSFNCLSAFKKHVTKKHVSITTNLSQNAQLNFPNAVITNNDVNDDFVVDNQYEKNCSNNSHVPFNFDEMINCVYESSVKFILSLYNNNNFNNVDVVNIQSGIKQCILKPMASILKKVVEKDIKEPLLLSTFHKIEILLLNPFQYCGTEHNLINWLKKNNLISKIKQFNINR